MGGVPEEVALGGLLVLEGGPFCVWDWYLEGGRLLGELAGDGAAVDQGAVRMDLGLICLASNGLAINGVSLIPLTWW